MVVPLAAPGGAGGAVLEVGPRLNFQTAWSANAVSICAACGVGAVGRLERSRRYLLAGPGGVPVPADSAAAAAFAAAVHDRMTETVYGAPLTSFDSGLTPAATYTVPLRAGGRPALAAVNAEMGLGFDEWDLAYYYDLFVGKLGRDPTSVELFDMAQSNSEHSRHWFFMGKLILDGAAVPGTVAAAVSAVPAKMGRPFTTVLDRVIISAAIDRRLAAIAPRASGEFTSLAPWTPNVRARVVESTASRSAVSVVSSHSRALLEFRLNCERRSNDRWLRKKAAASLGASDERSKRTPVAI